MEGALSLVWKLGSNGSGTQRIGSESAHHWLRFQDFAPPSWEVARGPSRTHLPQSRPIGWNFGVGEDPCALQAP